jgi:hypothetical protein
MAVSFLPILVPAVLIVSIIVRLCSKKWHTPATVSIGLCLCIYALVLLLEFGAGLRLRWKADKGDPHAQYEYSRWIECHCERIQSYFIWPCFPDVSGQSFAWLSKAAAQDYPAAMYALGVRLKHNQFVPADTADPRRGVDLIIRARNLGFRPPCDEHLFYYTVFRQQTLSEALVQQGRE